MLISGIFAELFLFWGCFSSLTPGVKAADYSIESQVLDIEGKTSEVYRDAVYGEWIITEYVGPALANPGISSVMPSEHGRSKEVGTFFSVGEDYFKYGENEKKEIIFFCNILPISFEPEQISFLPNGMTMKELNIDGEYFIYLEAKGQGISVQFMMQDGNHLVLIYLNEIYFCERFDAYENVEMGSFMDLSIADSQTSYCSLYEHEWRITEYIPYQEKVKTSEKEDKEKKKGKFLEFSHGFNGNVWLTVNREYRVKVNARISFISNESEKGEIRGYGTFKELNLNGPLITYISFNTAGTDAEWVKGIFVISEDKILLHGDDGLYCCERVTERLDPEDIRLR